MNKLFNDTLDDPARLETFCVAVTSLFTIMHILEERGGDPEASMYITDAVDILTDQLRDALDRKELVNDVLRRLHDER